MTANEKKPVAAPGEKKLWCCKVEIELPVVASSEEEAAEIAEEHIRDDIWNLSPTDFICDVATYYGGGWEKNSLPWGGDNDDEDIEFFMKKQMKPAPKSKLHGR